MDPPGQPVPPPEPIEPPPPEVPPEPPANPCPEGVNPWGSALPDPARRSTTEPFEGCASVEWLCDDIHVRAISADGSTLVGNAIEPDGVLPRAFRWRRGKSIEWLQGNLEVSDVSGDGTWIAATMFGADWDTSPVRIDPDGDVQVLGASGQAMAISADGRLVAGLGAEAPGQDVSTENAFRWSVEGGFQALPLWPDGEEFRRWTPSDMSADGSTVAGSGGLLFAYSSFSVVWTEQAGLMQLEPFAPLLSADGSLAAGTGCGCRYNGELKAVDLSLGEALELGFPQPSTPGSPSSVATSVNPDGSIVFGTGEATGPWAGLVSGESYIWQRDRGTQPLAQLVSDLCPGGAEVPLEAWAVTSSSADSRLLTVCSQDFSEPGHCWLVGWE